MLTAGVVLGTAPAGWAKPASPVTGPLGVPTQAGSPPGTARAGAGTVTLLTGDRVTLTPSGATSIRPAKGRQHIQFLTEQHRDAVYVIPQDAQLLVRDGKLDRRLFDVRGLIRDGYHDAARNSLPLLVSYRPGVASRAAATFTTAEAEVTRELPAIGGAAVSVGKSQANKFWATIATGPQMARTDTSGGVDRIWLDGKRRVSLDRSVAQIGAPAAYQVGFTGRGVTVAVLDTGVDVEHPDLVGKVAESRNFSEAPEDSDIIGHGTHVAATVAGSGAASGGKYRGVAPDATLLSGKVCVSTSCTDSAVLAGMQWAAAEKRATLVNLSLGFTDTPEIDPLEQAVNTLTAQTGTLFVISAGNDGGEGTVSSPGSADAALTVGAVDRDEQLADFSSQGPRVGDEAIKPDITAPGVDIVAARASGTDTGTPAGDGYAAMSGTSMAAPHVAGAAALLAQQHPTWKADQLKAALVASAKPNPALTAYQQGAGRVDVARAITQTVTGNPVSISYGRPAWPHDDDEPVTRTVTYRNPGAEAITLQLGTQVTGPGGASAPAGMFQVSATQVTVPAGGQAEVTVTADTSVTSPDGQYTGRLLATAGSTVVNTPLAVDKELESYNLTVAHVDADGAVTGNYQSVLLGLDEYRHDYLYDADGTVTVRLPKGRYGLHTWLDTPRESGQERAMLALPELTLSQDTTVTFDARQAKPVQLTVPEPGAVLAAAYVAFTFPTPSGPWSVTSGVRGGLTNLSVGNAGPTAPASRFYATFAGQWGKPDDQGTINNSPYLYSVSEVVTGQVPTGFVRHYRQQDLATVQQDLRGAMRPNGEVFREVIPVHPQQTGSVTAYVQTDLPGQRVEYYNTNNVRWRAQVYFERRDDPDSWAVTETVLASAPTLYQAGQHYQERWNAAPYGPTFPDYRPTDGLTRQGDKIGANPSLFSDNAGHLGESLPDTARTALYRNGVLVGENTEPGFGEFEVPSGQANYRLEASATRSVSELGTRVEAAWTFRSGHVDGDGPVRLPAMVVRYALTLDVANAAPAGRVFDIPVTVVRQPGAPAALVRSLTVEVSYDDGRTWQNAKVCSADKGWVASVQHPGQPGYVSLRAKAVDSAGNTVTQSVIRAYRLI
ncbi:S8 family serine peptidase [Micromonospora polyrhachis]|uniref:Subtilisin family serine protease n=1 Tax=Micromonospora polyrhachis TaxID=1282883 RepID=A0A7W7SSC7_9ACTN|nr:S8 family serine peptidase [Micromonospora polyrhachis]MBB4960068.1 subtilisin family serine protease [Micromonospora polyrhachis]